MSFSVHIDQWAYYISFLTVGVFIGYKLRSAPVNIQQQVQKKKNTFSHFFTEHKMVLVVRDDLKMGKGMT